MPLTNCQHLFYTVYNNFLEVGKAMKCIKFILLCVYCSVGCGGSSDGRLTSLTDMKSVLLYQHVEADRFRLLACPYAVDLDVASDCRNVFFTPEGDEYYFTGIPKQPWLFAPSHAKVKQLMTVPIVIGGAVVSWMVVRKIRTKLDVDAAKKKLLEGTPQSKKVADDVTDVTDDVTDVTNDVTDVTDDVTKKADEAAEQAVSLSQAEYRELADELNRLIEAKSSAFTKGGTYREDIPRPDEVGMGFEEIANKIADERAFMQAQFEIVDEAIDQYQAYDELFEDTSLEKLRNFLKLRGKPQTPHKIFEELKQVYNNNSNRMEVSYRNKSVLRLKNNRANEIIEEIRQDGDNIIAGEEDFLHKFTRLIERPDVLASIRANRSKYRSKTQVAEVQAVQSRAEEIVENSSDAHKSRGITDYVIAAVGGLLSGSYLPAKIPQLENYLFTEREWKKLFARDDSFKKPLKVSDSYAVVKKLTRYLKRKGEKVVINEQVFFGLKH